MDRDAVPSILPIDAHGLNRKIFFPKTFFEPCSRTRDPQPKGMLRKLIRRRKAGQRGRHIEIDVRRMAMHKSR